MIVVTENEAGFLCPTLMPCYFIMTRLTSIITSMCSHTDVSLTNDIAGSLIIYSLIISDSSILFSRTSNYQ